LTAQDWRAQVEQLQARAARQRHGEAKVMALEEAARLAEVHGDLTLAFEVRDELIDAATFGGYPDKALVAFAWCRAQQKKHPDRFDDHLLLWKQKWVVGRLDEFPHISRKQIHDALADIEDTYARANAGKRAVLKLRYQTARDMGDETEAEACWAKWVVAPRDHLTDCPACELDDEIDYHIDRGEYRQAHQKAAPLILGHQGCAEVPHLTYGSLLYPLFKLGALEEALRYHQLGYPLVHRNRDFLATVGEHLEFLVLTDNLSPALALFERHLAWALNHASHRDRFTFFAAAGFLWERLQEEDRETVSLRLPKGFPLHQPQGAYDTRALLGWVKAQAQDIAARFDARNGTARFQKLLARTAGLSKEVSPHPLSGR
jgi:tetratricopeptide (TPR) repeat protein